MVSRKAFHGRHDPLCRCICVLLYVLSLADSVSVRPDLLASRRQVAKDSSPDSPDSCAGFLASLADDATPGVDQRFRTRVKNGLAAAFGWAHSVETEVQWWSHKDDKLPDHCVRRIRRQLVNEFVWSRGLCDEANVVEAIPSVSNMALANPLDCARSSAAPDGGGERVVYFIDAYKNVPQLERLVRALQSPHSVILVQTDATISASFATDMSTMLENSRQTTDSLPVCWMRYGSVVRFTPGIARVALSAMKWALANVASWTHFVTLSAQDYPLVSPLQMRRLLSAPEMRSRSFFPPPDTTLNASAVRQSLWTSSCEGSPIVWPHRTSWGLNFTILMPHPWISAHVPSTLQKAPFLGRASVQWGRRSTRDAQAAYPLRAGLAWIKKGGFANVLSRDFCSFATGNPLALRLWTFFKRTLVADEHFLPTLFYNSPFDGISTVRALLFAVDLVSISFTAQNTSAAFMRWSDPHTAHNDILTLQDLPSITRTVNGRILPSFLFCRRLDTSDDSSAALMDRLDSLRISWDAADTATLTASLGIP